MTMKDCSFDGTLEYIHKNDVGVDGECRIAGFVGDAQRGAEFSKCNFEGNIFVNWNKKGALSAGRGIGGFVGRNTPHNETASFNIKTLFTDCISKGKIAIENSADSEESNLLYIGHLIGTSRNDNSTTHVETGCTYESVITVNGKELTIKK